MWAQTGLENSSRGKVAQACRGKGRGLFYAWCCDEDNGLSSITIGQSGLRRVPVLVLLVVVTEPRW